MARFNLYSPRDNYRTLVAARIVSDHNIPSGIDHYTFKIGRARGSGTDYYGTYNGLKQKIDANTPYDLLTGGSVKLETGDSIVLDASSTGLPRDLTGVAVQVEIYHSLKEPGHKVRDPDVRAAVEGLSSHLTSTGSGYETITVLLPRDLSDHAVRRAKHAVSTTPVSVASATFVNGAVSLLMEASPSRMQAVMVTASVTFEGLVGNDVLYIAISDGTNDNTPNGSYVRAGGSVSSVTTHFAEQVVANRTYRLRYRAAFGNPQVVNEAISAIAVET